MVKGQSSRPSSLDFDQVNSRRFKGMRSFHDVMSMPSPDITMSMPLSTPELEKIILVTNEGDLLPMGLTPANPPDDLLSQLMANTPTPLRHPTTMIESTPTNSNGSNNGNESNNFSNNIQNAINDTTTVQEFQRQSNNMYQHQVPQSPRQIIQNNQQQQSSQQQSENLLNQHMNQHQHNQNQLHQLQQLQTQHNANTISNNNLNQSIIQQPQLATIKQETQSLATTCTSPQLDTLLDEDNDILLKVKRKRERNRVAASKCRRRKIERITQLENEVHGRDEQIKKLKEENHRLLNQVKQAQMRSNDLEQENKLLKQEVNRLKICNTHPSC